MSTLKLLLEKPNRAATKPAKPKNSQQNNQPADMPLIQYFQVNFQHIHEKIHDIQGEVKQLRECVGDLNAKLDQLTTLLINQQAMLSSNRGRTTKQHQIETLILINPRQRYLS
jgi:hypothetical protein